MAKGASSEKTLGNLHVVLTRVFTKVLEKYERDLADGSKVDLETAVADELIAVAVEPNPAMLSAISKFLKDNEIMYDTEELEQLSATERRLQELKKSRGGKVVSLDGLPIADNG